MAKKNKRPMAWLGMGGQIVSSPATGGKVELRLVGLEPFTIWYAQLGRVLYSNGQWGPGLIRPVAVADLEIELSEARARGLA